MVPTIHHSLAGMFGSPQHDHVLHTGRVFQSRVDILLELDNIAPPVTAICGDHNLGLGVIESVLNGLGTEAPKITLWGAPIRAQASIAMGSSGTMGK